jgi:hypothetical protein
MLRRYAVGTAAGAAIIVSLTGCQGAAGGKNDSVRLTAAQAIDLASKKTSTVDTYKVDLTAAGTGQAAARLHGKIQVRLRPDVAASGILDAAAVHGQSIPGGERAILVGDYFYTKIPQQLTRFTGGKPWVRFSVSQAQQTTGMDIDALIKRANPADQTKIFTASKDVHQAGTESIDGVKTTHYEGTIDMREAAKSLDAKAQKTFDEFYQRADAKNLVFDLWLDKNNLPRKLVTKVVAKPGTLSTTMIFSDYNKSFSVSAPPANETSDGDQLKNSFGGNIPG